MKFFKFVSAVRACMHVCGGRVSVVGGSSYGTLGGKELKAFFSLSLECRDYRCVPQHPAPFVFLIMSLHSLNHEVKIHHHLDSSYRNGELGLHRLLIPEYPNLNTDDF